MEMPFEPQPGDKYTTSDGRTHIIKSVAHLAEIRAGAAERKTLKERAKRENLTLEMLLAKKVAGKQADRNKAADAKQQAADAERRAKEDAKLKRISYTSLEACKQQPDFDQWVWWYDDGWGVYRRSYRKDAV